MMTSGISKYHHHHQDRVIELRDGRKLGFAEYGDPDGKPIVYMHGGGCCRLDIAFAHDVARHLHVRLIAPDRPGIGLSDRKVGRTLLDWAQDFQELIQQLNLPSVSVLGWSLGGPYALACASHAPASVRSAGIVGSATPLDRPGAIEALGSPVDRYLFRWKGWPRDLLSLGIDACRYIPGRLLRSAVVSQLRCLSDRRIIESLPPAEAVEFVVEGLRQGPLGIMEDYDAVGVDWGFRLTEFRTPLTIWQGKDDTMCPMSYARYLNDQVPNSRLIIVPDVGHFLLRHKVQDVFTELMR